MFKLKSTPPTKLFRTAVVLLMFALALSGLAFPAHADVYTVTLDPAARSEPATGRVILFFITGQGRGWPRGAPIEGPFFEKPQPIASVAVEDFKPGASTTLDGSTFAFPASLDTLDGEVRVQAILDADQTERGHEIGPGNVFSDVMTVKVSKDAEDRISLTLNHRVEAEKTPTDQPNLKWIRLRSELLSAFYRRDIIMRAGVALPKPYLDPEQAERVWPAVYVIPGYGGRDDGAAEYADMFVQQGIEEIAPMAVHIVLDGDAPLGHHGFADSANNGPRGEALIKELIPHLEKTFRLAPKSEARIVTGHSSGGWSALWLQLNDPQVFGGCWASAPDPIDFSAFQMADLYADTNLYRDRHGHDTPSLRAIINSRGQEGVRMTARQEGLMEHAIDPDGRSGQQWDGWEAMFSPKDEKTGLPKPMFNALAGEIDRTVISHWARYDITSLVRARWETLGPVVLNHVRLACGTEDSFYLNRAVERFKLRVDGLHGETPWPENGGYILMVERANHGTLTPKIFMRWNEEMRAHFERHGFKQD